MDESDEEEVVYLRNSVASSHGFLATKAPSPAKSDKSGKGRGVMSPQLRRSVASAITRDSPPLVAMLSLLLDSAKGLLMSVSSIRTPGMFSESFYHGPRIFHCCGLGTD